MLPAQGDYKFSFIATPADEAVMFGKTNEILTEVLGPDAMPVTPVMDALDDISPASGTGT